MTADLDQLSAQVVVRSENIGPIPEFEPFTLGPVWQKDAFGQWLLPERTLGWTCIEWCADNLIGAEGEGPWTFTDEQARIVLWIYALDEDGRWLYEDLVIQRCKGWGKDPFAAVLSAFELVGPCRFSHWDEDGEPVGKAQNRAWVQIVGPSRENTKNAMTMLQGLFNRRAIANHYVEIFKELIYAQSAVNRLEVVTSSPRTLEGNRPTFVVRGESHHWVSSNDGLELDAVIRRNLGKIKGGQARGLSVTNAYNPGEDSVGRRAREDYDNEIAHGRTRTLYDTLEAPQGTPLFPDWTRVDADGNRWRDFDAYDQMVPPDDAAIRAHLTAVLEKVRGDSDWLNIDRIVNEILSTQTSPADARRFYLNSSESSDDAYLLKADIDAMVLPEMVSQREREHGDTLRLGWAPVMPTDPVVLFFDGSKSDDSTAIVGCRLSDGYVFLVGIWEKPSGDAGRGWRAPRAAIDGRVTEAFDRFNVVAFWGDPSHAKDDEDGTRYWDVLLDDWHVRYGDRLQYWAVQGGDHRSSTMWDMATPGHQAVFSEAVVRFAEEVEDHAFRFDGHPALKAHLVNARSGQGRYGTVIRKPARGGRRKIDAAVCAIGARMLARLVLIKGLETQENDNREFWW